MFASLTTLALRYPRWLLWSAGSVILIGFVAGAVAANGLTTGLSDYDDPGAASARAQHDVRAATGIDLEQGYLVLVRTGARLAPRKPVPPVVARAEALLRSRPEVRAVQDFATTGDPR